MSKKKLTSIRGCEIVSLLEKDGEPLFHLDTLDSLLESKKCISDHAYIIHDKDRYTAEDEKRNPEHKEGTLKPAHIHLLLRFEEKQPQKLEYVAKWFNLAPNFVSKIHGSWKDACLYLTHRNTPKKHQYPADAVVSSFDYQDFLDKVENAPNINTILQKIFEGEIREYNKTLEIDHMTLVQCRRSIEDAFKIRAEHLQTTMKERNTECIFITGASGTGKTTLAKKMAKARNLDYFVSSGSNDILDGYGQEPCLILDDIRPSCMGLSDMLKMLDPHTASSVKSRYKNKYLNCDLIILTTVLGIDNFYENVFSEQKEPITQLQRRCKTYIEMKRDAILVSIWDDKKMRYSPHIAYKNTILQEYIPEKVIKQADVEDYVKKFFPFLERLEDIENTVFDLTKITETKSKPSKEEQEQREQIDKILAPILQYQEKLREESQNMTYEEILQKYDETH